MTFSTADTVFRTHASRARDLQAELQDAQARVDQLAAELKQLTEHTLVDAMNQAGYSHTTLQANGNLPAVELELTTVVRASMPVSWPAERREEGYDQLPEDLVKWTVTVSFPKGQGDQAAELARHLRHLKLPHRVVRGVNHMTLTSWLKQQLEEGGELPELEKIGAYIGQVVKI